MKAYTLELTDEEADIILSSGDDQRTNDDILRALRHQIKKQIQPHDWMVGDRYQVAEKLLGNTVTKSTREILHIHDGAVFWVNIPEPDHPTFHGTNTITFLNNPPDDITITVLGEDSGDLKIGDSLLVKDGDRHALRLIQDIVDGYVFWKDELLDGTPGYGASPLYDLENRTKSGYNDKGDIYTINTPYQKETRCM